MGGCEEMKNSVYPGIEDESSFSGQTQNDV